MASATPPSDKRREIEDNVLRATEALLGEGSRYADLGVERIATAAGISRTAFYFYFKDKRELLMRLTEEVTELLYAEADAWFTGAAPLDEALRRVFALYEEHGPLLRAIVEVSTYEETTATFWRALVARFVGATEQRIAAAGGDPLARATAFSLVWMTERAYYEHLVQEDPPPRDELVDAIVRIWERAIGNAAR